MNPYATRAATLCAVLLTPALALADDALTLPTTQVDGQGETSAQESFAPTHAQVGKSDLPLAETPRSVQVVSRAVLDSTQAQSLTDALNNVPGVTAGQYGRRGWDDLIIRGQVASDSLFLDGLRTASSNRVAEQVFGLEQVEVLKGPASMEYGLVLPGGVVNMVSKRPQAEAFARLGVTYGSHDLRQSTFDVGTPLSANGKAALRVNGLLSDSNDATDHVWFKNNYIAPSLSLDLGEDTDFTLLTSHQDRSYIRQQGLPLSGSINPNPNGSLPRSRFTGEPGQSPYHGVENRVGYSLAHRFGEGWTFTQNLRWQDFRLDGQLVSNSTFAANNTLRRSAQTQHWDGDTLSLDNNLQKLFDTALGTHDITAGVDYLRLRESTVSYTCTVGNLNAYNPVYGQQIDCPSTPRTWTDITTRMTGAYVRDNWKINDRWLVTAGLRRDMTDTYGVNHLSQPRRIATEANATTGAVAVMYEVVPNVRPYLSYATSFFPNTGTDVNGNTFKPEEGEQWEAGIKFDLVPGRTLLTVATYDLRRKNVLQADPVHTGSSIAVGEQRSQGLEVELNSDVTDKLSLIAGYAYTWATVTDDGGQTQAKAITEGDRLNNVPRHTANLFARYRFNGTPLGWEVNGGFNAASERYTNGYYLPGYAVANVGVAYATPHWRTALNVRNLFDQHYYAGGLASAVALGDDRTALMSVTYSY
ncbi:MULTISPECIES: TonB-dependent siderophore receptor [unclassified Pseudomonas]|uniref:TonB-dependent siderophore receptor n=1 Tax=unclassified Pseudomonas TaxID=196821 RepID=UPI000BCB41CD|nr:MULTISPECIES: TonB-dependent siderophore receptor [unclassified Pseudomonas]PVZ20440.1 iron complex outermembrane receptor protein [Pseudomonas sp. URIL14HWK12:I12]PVZ27506.1 iron complex outermembrane receptor protein [Pseudomonas sp. URIL14HWK12:I10]PVZ38395.1 iron complex outermembrane receptor protein [Pseudomonas sp. URIL14HWK12:I11]SNZ03528.1 iron complex outermembrane recepter protein [Pseudomonas sp. URIL14HWK12:I9]